MSIATADAVDSLQATLEPLEALHGEHSQLETWVHDSFSALEKLHSELTEWQSELARKQTELDLREDSLSRTEPRQASGEISEQLELLQKDLSEAREEAQQLEEENAEQLQELENMELKIVQLEKELTIAQKRLAELNHVLEVERDRAAEEQHHWQGEIRDMRRLLEKQCTLLEDRIRDARESTETDASGCAEGSADNEGTSRTAELRRRAKSRWAAKLRRHREGDQPNAS